MTSAVLYATILNDDRDFNAFSYVSIRNYGWIFLLLLIDRACVILKIAIPPSQYVLSTLCVTRLASFVEYGVCMFCVHLNGFVKNQCF